MTKKIISIVISAYNEEGNIHELYKQLLQNTKEKDCRYKYGKLKYYTMMCLSTIN